MIRQNSRENQQVAARFQICEFWAFCNLLWHSEIQNGGFVSDSESVVFRDLGGFSVLFGIDGDAV